MGKLLSGIVKEAKQVPRSAWIAAVVIPGGFIAMGTYLITKTVQINKEKDDQRKNSEGFNRP